MLLAFYDRDNKRNLRSAIFQLLITFSLWPFYKIIKESEGEAMLLALKM